MYFNPITNENRSVQIMYCKNDFPLLTNLQIPPLEPLITLKKWFERPLVLEAFSLLQKKQHSTLFFRHCSGTVFDDCTVAAFSTVHSEQLVGDNHVYRDYWCNRCPPDKKKGHRCIHTAAAALLSLLLKENQYIPTSLLFSQSPWHTIGIFLYNRAEHMSPQIRLSHEKDGWLFTAKKQEFDLEMRLSDEETALLGSLHPGIHIPEMPRHGNGSLLVELEERLSTMSMNTSEKELSENGRQSRGLHCDSSLWMHLARRFFLHAPEPEFFVSRNSEGLFSLTIRNPCQFSLRLPRHHTSDILARIGPNKKYRRLDPAIRCDRVRFNSRGDQIHVDHMVRDNNGHCLTLSQLEKQRYGDCYFLENLGFLPTTPLPLEQRIKEPDFEQAPSLFALASPAKKNTTTGFTVEQDEIPVFLEKNQKALLCGRHDVEKAVIDLEVVIRPDKLELTDFEIIDDWCYLAGYYLLGNQRISIVKLLEEGEKNNKYIPGKKWLLLENSDLAWFHGLGAERIITEKDRKPQKIRIHPFELRALSGQIKIRKQKGRVKWGKKLRNFLRTDDPKLHEKISRQASHLRDYQKIGAVWLQLMADNRLGCILADDMGLGKTHQALAMLNYSAASEKNRPFLVVCPAAVLYHWSDKATDFFPELQCLLYYGVDRSLVECGENHLVITTYTVMRNDIDALSAFHFQVIVYDEMHYLKNKQTESYRAARQLSSDSVIGLTGTPMENNLGELQALLELCLPGFFDTSSFRRQFMHSKSSASRRQLRKMISPFILHRTRKQVLTELPETIEDIRLCRLHDDQLGLYRQAIGGEDDLLHRLVSGGQVAYANILTVIGRLKQICDHPCLLEGCIDADKYRSGKWEVFTELVEECRVGNFKTVIFSQYTSMLDIMEHYLKKQNIDFVGLRGSMTAKQRSKAITRFNENKQYLFCCVSLLAGGVGIDLTGARVVIHYDRWWNPAREEQATARVHRMGQKHCVQVIKLITAGTLEEKIHQLIMKKRKMAADVIGEDDASLIKGMPHDELASLLTMGLE